MKTILLFFLILVVISCEKSDTEKGSDSLWTEISIPNGRETFAISGDINKRLLVTTWTKAFYSEDEGKTWVESYNFNGPVYDLFTRNDTVFALIGYQIGDEGVMASECSKYTTDYGLTWEYDKENKYSSLTNLIGEKEMTDGTVYIVKENKTQQVAGSSSFYLNPSTIERYSETGSKRLELGKKIKINNIYIDKGDYLYIAASSGLFDENDNYTGVEANSPAKVYISTVKRP